MPRKGQRLKTRKPTAIKPAGPTQHHTDPLAHNALVRYMEDHFEWMLVTGYSADTVRARRQALRKFIAWCDERGLSDPRDITRPMLERYQRYLYYYRKPSGKDSGAPLSMGMQAQYRQRRAHFMGGVGNEAVLAPQHVFDLRQQAIRPNRNQRHRQRARQAQGQLRGGAGTIRP